MEDIQLYIDKDKVLKLRFLDAITPLLVHPKADDWKFVYKLYYLDKLFDDGLFTSNYSIFENRSILILEEYDISILNDTIKTDEDVVMNLRFFDLAECRTGKFSKLTGGSFLIQKLIGSKLIFSKKYHDRTKEFEVDIGEIKLVETRNI